jgi:hypothetical protein
MTDVLPFSHDYPKLHEKLFPTLRRRDKFGDVGDTVTVTVDGEKVGAARIIAKETRAWKNMSTEFVTHDTDSEDRDAALDSINEFYRNPVEPSEELTQYVCIWLEGPEIYEQQELATDGGGYENLTPEGRQTELLEEIRDAEQRQARALERLAGIQMMMYEARDDTGRYTPEAIAEDALLHGSGGERP